MGGFIRSAGQRPCSEKGEACRNGQHSFLLGSSLWMARIPQSQAQILSEHPCSLQSKRETKTQGEFRYKSKNKKNQSIHCLLKFSVMFLHTQRFKDLEGMAPLRLGRAGPGPVSCLRASAELATCWALLISGVVTLGLDRSFRPSLVEPVQENGCGLCSDGGN